MDQYVLQQPVIMLATAIILAILVERIIEISKALFDYFTVKKIYARADDINIEDNIWTRLAQRVAKKLEARLDNAKSHLGEKDNALKNEGKEKLDLILKMAEKVFSPAKDDHDGLFAVSASKVRGIYLKLIAKIISIALGIALAAALKIDIIYLVKLSLEPGCAKDVCDFTWGGCLLTGIAMGFGAGPMHKIIVALEKRQKKNLKGA